MTIEGLRLFLDIGYQTWRDYCKREDYSEVTAKIEDIIRTQKFSGAAADLLNANIIARDLGLADKKEIDGNMSVSDMTEDQLDARLKALISQAEETRALKNSMEITFAEYEKLAGGDKAVALEFLNKSFPEYKEKFPEFFEYAEKAD